MLRSIVLVFAVFLIARVQANSHAAPANISGELKQWHKVTLTVDGPEASEDGDPNPFTDFRMQVTFTHPASGLTYSIPGYFAADGDAANSGATSGNQWRAHISPDHTGTWEYSVSFRSGNQVAVNDDVVAGSAVEGVDGIGGSFVVAATDKSGRDFRGKGRLTYVGEHHLQFAGSKEFFLKAGVDAPENFLAYDEFDGGFGSDGHKDQFIKNWAPHIQDWNEGDPTWRDNKGKGIIGAINYLAGQGLNVFSFLTLNIDGDDRNVFPYTSYDERTRLDCSRLDQWEIVFSHGTKNGMYLHFKTQECENVNLLDNGFLGPQRKLYYRELIARFGHHLAMNWNLGEEVGLRNPVSTEKKIAWANYFAEHDPYHHHLVIHNGNKHYDLLGDASPLTGFSLQTNRPDFSNVHGATLNYLRRSVESGKPWVVACDEPGDASHSLIPDSEDPTRDDARQNALWGNLMAGGAGIEWYFGYKHDHSDLTCQDYRVRELMWKQSQIAIQFFADQEIPFWQMTNANDLIDPEQAYCLKNPDDLFLVYRKRDSKAFIDLSSATGIFEVLWFDPRAGGDLQYGSAQAIQGGGPVDIGEPPSDTNRDWLAVIRPGDPKRSYASVTLPSADATSVGKKTNSQDSTTLLAIEDFDLLADGDFIPGYFDKARKALAINAAKYQDKFAASISGYDGPKGEFDLVLTTLTETDGESSYRVFVGGKKIGEVTNPETTTDYRKVNHRFKAVQLSPGDLIRVEFNSASNGKIPEGDAFAYSRGRWTSLAILKPNARADQASKPAKTKSSQASPFIFDYDPTEAKKVSVQTNGIVVVEAEDFDKVDRQEHRKWYLTTLDKTPEVTPDPDPNHAEGASGGAYIELLPDTRVTHADPLVGGVSFTNNPGECSVLYYPVEIKEPGRYYVWVRMCCTGSEDNGLHVGLDGKWPASGARLQFTSRHGQWQWDSRQRTSKVHTGVLGQIWLDIEEPGLHTIMFSMREDGFEFDKFMLTQEKSPMKSKSLIMGPQASPAK